MELRPVTFQYKESEEDGSKPIQYGLIAEEVEKVMADLVVYNDQREPETVAYQTLAPLLLNELQKERKQIEQDHSELASMRAQLAEVDALRAAVGELRHLTAQLVAERSNAGSREEPVKK